MSLKTTFLQTGTNLGDRYLNLATTNQLITKQIGMIVQASKIYETAAWGVTDQPDFYNQVLKVQTNLSPLHILEAIQNIENQLGRIRKEKWGARIIDVDILFYEQEVVKNERLIIPHPEIQNRNFVLIPLLEIAPYWETPRFKKSVEELYIVSTDTLEVIQLDE